MYLFIILFLLVYLSVIILLIFTIFKNWNKSQYKWLALTFSENTLIPEKGIVFNGAGGLEHNKQGYLSTLPIIAKQLNRKAVLPPPWLSLEITHNNGNRVDKNDTWSDYYDTDFFKNIDFNPPLIFEDNGSILSKKSIKYYDITTPLKDFDKNIDIIVLTNFNNPKTGNFSYSYLPIRKLFKISFKFVISKLLKKICDNLIKEFDLQNYTFIHLRRGDTLDNESYAPPRGTRQYTDPNYVAKFLNKFSKDNTIVIATNEKDSIYKEKLISLLPEKNLIWEENLQSKISINIVKNNYKMYQIMSELANRSNCNIITSRLRLGKKINYSLMKKYSSIV